MLGSSGAAEVELEPSRREGSVMGSRLLLTDSIGGSTERRFPAVVARRAGE
jgi:hypothetical protein